jgi:hypothetical protein
MQCGRVLGDDYSIRLAAEPTRQSIAADVLPVLPELHAKFALAKNLHRAALFFISTARQSGAHPLRKNEANTTAACADSVPLPRQLALLSAKNRFMCWHRFC